MQEMVHKYASENKEMQMLKQNSQGKITSKSVDFFICHGGIKHLPTFCAINTPVVVLEIFFAHPATKQKFQK